MEMLKEFEEQEENKAPDDVDDDTSYEISDLFCEEVDEEDYDLCSGSGGTPFAHLVQSCGDKICTNCVKKIFVNYLDVEYPITTIDFE